MSDKINDFNNFTEREKLQILYEQFLLINHKFISMKFDTSRHAVNYANNALANSMFKLYGYTELPQVVKDQDYKKLQAREFFRGIENMDYHAELLSNEDYYQGYWHNGIGIFCTTKSEWAEGFTLNKGTDHVIKFKYVGKILDRINDKGVNLDYYRALRLGHYETIQDENIIKKCQMFRDFINDKQSDVPNIKGIDQEYAKRCGKQDFADLIICDETFMSTFLGFDGFEFDINGYRSPEMVIQKRGKMVVSLSEYNRICQASQNYKHCIKTEVDLTSEMQLEST